MTHSKKLTFQASIILLNGITYAAGATHKNLTKAKELALKELFQLAFAISKRSI